MNTFNLLTSPNDIALQLHGSNLDPFLVERNHKQVCTRPEVQYMIEEVCKAANKHKLTGLVVEHVQYNMLSRYVPHPKTVGLRYENDGFYFALITENNDGKLAFFVSTPVMSRGELPERRLKALPHLYAKVTKRYGTLKSAAKQAVMSHRVTPAVLLTHAHSQAGSSINQALRSRRESLQTTARANFVRGMQKELGEGPLRAVHIAWILRAINGEGVEPPPEALRKLRDEYMAGIEISDMQSSDSAHTSFVMFAQLVGDPNTYVTSSTGQARVVASMDELPVTVVERAKTVLINEPNTEKVYADDYTAKVLYGVGGLIANAPVQQGIVVRVSADEHSAIFV